MRLLGHAFFFLNLFNFLFFFYGGWLLGRTGSRMTTAEQAAQIFLLSLPLP